MSAQAALTEKLTSLYGELGAEEVRLEACKRLLVGDLQALSQPHDGVAMGAARGLGAAAACEPGPSDNAADLGADDLSRLPWPLLTAVKAPAPAEETASAGGAAALTVSSGGAVYFLSFSSGLELVLKVCASSLEAQSEYFATQLVVAAGVAAPRQRLLRRATHAAEWEAMAASVGTAAGGEDAAAMLRDERVRVLLLMSKLDGAPLLRCPAALEGPRLAATARELGRLLVVDLLLGNEDRLACEALRWRGNPGNLLWSEAGVGAIDSGLARRPPPFVRDAAVKAYPPFVSRLLPPRLASGEGVAEGAGAGGGVGGGASADGALDASGHALLAELLSFGSDRCRARLEALEATPRDEAVRALRAGAAEALAALRPIVGWLARLDCALCQILDDFFQEAEASEACCAFLLAVPAAGGGSGAESPARRTGRLGRSAHWLRRKAGALSAKEIFKRLPALTRRAARSDSADASRVADVRAWVARRGDAARASLDEWRSAEGDAAGGLPTGFIDEEVAIAPIAGGGGGGEGGGAGALLASAYELRVRLDHLLARWQLLCGAS